MSDFELGQPRPARIEETEAVRNLVVSAYTHYVARMGKPPGPMLDDYARRIADGQAWVVETGGAIAGLVVLEDDGDALLLDNIAVAPSAQGKGLGRALMAFVETEARRLGHPQVRLYTNALMTENIVLYGRLGFHETGRLSEDGFDRVYMCKPLD